MEELRYRFFKVSLLVLVLSVFNTSGSVIITRPKVVCASEECLAAATMLENSMDTTINPCDDFFQYACGNWPKNYASKNDPSMYTESFDLRYTQNEEEITGFLQQNNTSDEPESVHKARQLYSLCLDPESYNGIEQLQDILSKIGLPVVPLSTKENPDFDYVSVLAKATKLAGIDTYFDIAVDTNPYNHSLMVIWLDNPSNEITHSSRRLMRKQVIMKREVQQQPEDEIDFMEKVIKKMCAVSSLPSCAVNDSDLKADILIQAEDRDYIRDKARVSSFIPDLYTLEELQSISDNIADKVNPSIPKFNWTRYIEEIFDGLENIPSAFENSSNVQIVIDEMEFVEEMIGFIYERNITEMEFGLWWDVVSTLLPYADYDIFQAKYNITSPDQQEKRCTKIVTSWFQNAIGYMYSNKAEYNDAKIEIETMLKYIKDSFKTMFEQATWMDEETKEKAVIKLSSIESLIAYPNPEQLLLILEEMYGDIEISRSFLGTMVTMIQNEIEDNLSWNQTDETTTQFWMEVPITDANAYYYDEENMIAIPVGLLGSPVYINSSNALNYGSLGSVVGHELAHGFDPTGKLYNYKGVLEDWWNNVTSVKFENKSKCFLEAYDNYNSTFQGIDQKVNSSITWNEDIADNVGFKAALLAYRSYLSEVDDEPLLHSFQDFTPEQMFTLGFANSFCESPTNDIISDIPFMYHSPNGVRINGVLKNSEEFSSIWNCPKGANMNPEDEKCSLW